jgi:hypothetical protein
MFTALASYGGITIEFYNPPTYIRDGVRDSLTVRFKISGMAGSGPWAVTSLRLYESDVFSDDQIVSLPNPGYINTQDQWYYYTFQNIVFSNYEPANDGLELYSSVYIAGYSATTPILTRTIHGNLAPATPATLNYSALTDHAMSLYWPTSTDPEGDIVRYNVEYGRSDLTGDGWTHVGTTTNTALAVTGLTADAPYIIRLTALDEYGAMGASKEFGPIRTYKYNPTYPPAVSSVALQSGEMFLRQRFQITADITDQTAQADLDQAILCVYSQSGSHSATLSLDSMDCAAPTDYYRVVDVQKSSIANGYRVTWTICPQATLANDGDSVAVSVKVIDKEQNESTEIANFVVFKKTDLPKNKWTVISHGKINQNFLGNGPGPWDWPASMSSWFQTQSKPDGWMYEIGSTLNSQSKTPVKIHRVRHESFELETWNPATSSYELSATIDTNAHHILLFDWSNPSDFLDALAGLGGHNQANWYAYAAGDSLFALLCKMGVENNISTFVGYSRGGVVSSEVARRLLLHGSKPFQVLLLDAEGWGDGFLTQSGYKDYEFHGWAGTRTDQYRQRISNSGEADCGAEALDQGNDRILQNWPSGFGFSDDMSHKEWPDYFTKSVYITEDSVIGTCLETPHFWKDDDGAHTSSEVKHPTQAPKSPPLDNYGFFNPYFDDYSLAGWCYHGGGGQNRLGASVDDNGQANLCQFAPSIKHNWSKLSENLHYSFLKMSSVAAGLTVNSELALKWNDLLCSESLYPATGIHTIPVDINVDEVGVFNVELTGMTSVTEVNVDNFEFITSDKPTIGSLSLSTNSIPLGSSTILTAHDMLDADGIKTLEIYADKNSNSIPEPTEFLTSKEVTFSSTASLNIETSTFSIGNLQLLARVNDMNDIWSDVHNITLIVVAPQGDKDADLLPDDWESKYFASETNALPHVDPDGDGFDNLAEYIAGTNPTNSASYLTTNIESKDGAGFVLRWLPVSNRVYSIFSTPTLTSIFEKISSDLPYPINCYTDTTGHASSHMFYKIGVKLGN